MGVAPTNSAQFLDFLDLAENFSFLDWKQSFVCSVIIIVFLELDPKSLFLMNN